MIKTYSNEKDIVLDFCMGSGTTGVAAMNINRRFIGIERNSIFFNEAKKGFVKIRITLIKLDDGSDFNVYTVYIDTITYTMYILISMDHKNTI